MKKVIAILLSLLCVMLVFASCGKGEAPDGSEVTQGAGGSQFPMGDEIFKDTESTDLDGNKVDDSIFKGKKLTMVNVWGTFCSPCIGEMPDLQTISEEYADKGFQIIGIVCDVDGKGDTEKIKVAKEICKDTGVKYPSLVPSESLDYAILDSVVSVPATFFLDENGKQIGRNYIGSRSLDGWKTIIDSIYAELEN